MRKTTEQIIIAAAQGDGIDRDRIARAVKILNGEDEPRQTSEPEDRLLTVKEAREYLRCGRSSLWRAEQEGQLQSVWFRKRKLYELKSLKGALIRQGLARSK